MDQLPVTSSHREAPPRNYIAVRGVAVRWRRASALGPLLAAAVLLAAACGGDDAADATPSVAASRTAPAGDASPATGGQSTPTVGATEAPAAGPIEGAYTATEAVPQADFERMLAMVPVPGDAEHVVVVTQYEGIAYRVSLTDESEEPTVFLDLSAKLIVGPRNEEGFLGFAFAPDFEQSGRFYTYYSAGEPRRTVLERYIAPDGIRADPASGRVLLEVGQPAANHNGGALVFGPDGYLYVALGDGGSGGENGQRLDTLLGKILRIDVSGDGYTVPADNPFAGIDAEGEIWAYGFRNPWRMSFDRETGDLWAGDVGQGTWEEIDRVERGGNYGWSIMEGPDCYRGADCDRDGLVLPRASYRTNEGGCAVTGGYVYRGEQLPELRGWYVYGDYCSGRVWALDTRQRDSEPILLMASDRQIASFGEDFDGELYLVTFDRAIYRITHRAP